MFLLGQKRDCDAGMEVMFTVGVYYSIVQYDGRKCDNAMFS